ncbi:MAG: SusC/RagA family TonB-linked outer membrane protein, partial [Tannerellaceae bacterium]|nr:SusC/RagA family TonB-linked outer membrane protein [Tannerellaceae bacterium]
MKIRNLLSFTIYLLLCAPVWSQAQEANVTINLSNTRISEVFEEIETQTSYTVAYNESVIDPSTRINVSLSNKPLSQAMTEILSGLNAMFRIEGKKILILSAPSAPMYSDRKTVSGKVVDTHGEPIIGANIVESGTTNGTTTDIDGNFSLEVASNALLTLTYIGYTQQELSVSNRTVFKLVMHENAQTLEEVVVVGYGVQKKKLVTGATIHVSGEDVSKMNSTSVLGALQSQSPGLSITKTSGQPGSDFKVSIRGIGTTGNSTPLFIVDGVTVGNISNLNTADIEAIDVLKDAASSAIYGSRAANGVILITTKQGEKGKVSLQYDGYYAIQTTYRMPKPLNAQDYAMIMSESARNSGLPDFDYAKLVPDWNKIESGQWSGTNWLEEITNNKAPMQNHSLNLTGGNEHGKYSMGLSYLDQLGIIGKPANPYYQRYTFRINTEFVVAKNRDFDILKIGESLTYSYTKRSGNLSTGGANNNIRSALATNPFLPMYDETGEYHYTLPWFEPHANPYAIIDYAQKNRENLSQAINGRIYVSIQPIKDLILLSGFGINTISDYARSYTPTFHIGSDPAHIQTIDIVSQSQSSSLRWIFDTTLNYKKGFAQNMLSVMVGMSAERSGIGQNISGSNQGSVFDSFKFAYLDNVPTISPELTTLGGAPLVETRLLSFFSRLNYDYKETYMLSLIFRADGSSNFAPNNRWAYFPSVSAGWVITNTDFIMRAIPRMGFLKLRASWGQNGNSAISPFQYLGTINMSDGIAVYFPGIDKSLLTQGAYPDIAPNPDIKWETSEQLNIGFDSRFFNSKLYINFDWYNKMTKDWLVRAPILGSSGTG